jgi:hypothetical protein
VHKITDYQCGVFTVINAVLRQGKPEEEVYSGEYYAGGRRKAGTLTAPGGDQYIGK